MTGFQHINIVRTKDDIVWLTIDSKDNNENALTISLLKEMREVLDNLQGKGFKGLIISSAKSEHFIAGTDLETLLKLTTEKKAEIYTSLGNQLCRRISTLDFPTIALINGDCSNSGLEIALCCDYRIATKSTETLFYYSDIKHGYYAGFGSITRLIKTKGLASTLKILNGTTYTAENALSIGLIDYIVPAHKTHQAAKYLIAQDNDETNQKPSPSIFKSLSKTFVPNKLSTLLLNHQYNSSAISSIIETWNVFNASSDASHNEAIGAAKLILSDATKNQLKLQKLYQKLDHDITATAPQSQRIHIMGCGVMGRYIARLCAENGFYISIYDTRYAALEKLLPELYQDCDHKNHAQLRHKFIDRVIIDVDNSGLTHADIIIEAIPENKHAKASLLHDIEKQAKPSAAILTTTACLPLEEIAKGMKTPPRLAAFNPYHPLFTSKIAEISTLDNPPLSERIQSFSKALQLKPIPVKSNSGYLGTRLLMTYLIESMLIHQSGISTQAIDKLTASMGMSHAPFDLIDSIGISECLQVNEALADRLNYDVPSILMQKNEQGLKGKDSGSGSGFYHYKKGKKQQPIFDKTLNSPSWKTKSKAIEKRLIEKIINEARSCQQQDIVSEQEIIDLVATIITGFAAEKGGPLAYLQQLQSGKV